MPASVSTDIYATDRFQMILDVSRVRVCVSRNLFALDASSAQVLSATSNLSNTLVSCVALLLVMCLLRFMLCDLIQDMKLGKQTR